MNYLLLAKRGTIHYGDYKGLVSWVQIQFLITDSSVAISSPDTMLITMMILLCRLVDWFTHLPKKNTQHVLGNSPESMLLTGSPESAGALLKLHCREERQT